MDGPLQAGEAAALNLNRLIRRKNIKFFFRINIIADLNAVRGFISVLGIKRRTMVIRCGSEVTQAAAKKALTGCVFTTGRALSKNWLPVIFDSNRQTHLARDGRLILNYDPYKYCHSVRVSSKERVRLRRAMRIKKNRKVIVVSCSTRDEVEVILKAYKRLDLFDQPLLILGLRRPDAALPGFLNRRGFRTHDRRSLKQALSYCGESDVVVLNTMGELFNFLKVADLAIMGHDRNIFEPALLNVPILYFGSPLNMSQNDKKMADLFKLFWRKNRTAKSLLDRTGGAHRIDLAFLHHQITKMLRFPDKAIRGTQKAVRLFHRQVIPANRLCGTRLLASAVMAKSAK